jgi:hypothetical protein
MCVKSIKRSDEKLLEEYLDISFKKPWLRKKLVDMFEYNDRDNCRRDV